MDYAIGMLFKSLTTELAREAAAERLARQAAAGTRTPHRLPFHWRSRQRPHLRARTT